MKNQLIRAALVFFVVTVVSHSSFAMSVNMEDWSNEPAVNITHGFTNIEHDNPREPSTQCYTTCINGNCTTMCQ